MRVLFTAAGSIGSRHIKNLTEVCNHSKIPLEIDVVRYWFYNKRNEVTF